MKDLNDDLQSIYDPIHFKRLVRTDSFTYKFSKFFVYLINYKF
jgi:hypothetical protein